jgi:hypothetical protein
MVHAYMVRADEEALAHGERLLRLYPEEAKGKDYHQTAQIVADLKRRQKKGTFGKEPSETWPDGFEKWNVKKKSAYLIESLEEVDERQWGQPGDVMLHHDRRVKELIQLGEPAIPELIDVLEKDERLTRSVHFWRDFGRHRTVLAVRDPALVAIMTILRVSFFATHSTSDSLTARGEEDIKKVVGQIRAYWKEYGALSFDERMMKVLANPQSTFEAKREAAQNLATINQERYLSPSSSSYVDDPDSKQKPNPAVQKFRNPTAAELILATMDAELKAHDAKPPKVRDTYDRDRAEEIYLTALVGLGDKRIGPEIAKRVAATTTLAKRRQWAQAAHFLGEPKPFQVFAEEFRSGKMEIPANSESGVKYITGSAADRELMVIVNTLINVGSREADRALEALADPKHPFHQAASRQILSTGSIDERSWFGHPYCLRILGAGMDNRTLTGATFTVNGNSLGRKSKNSFGSQTIPDFLADPDQRLDTAEERTCDAAAQKLSELVVGLPNYHALQKYREESLAELKITFDRLSGKFRIATRREKETLGITPWHSTFIPDIRLLNRAATADDVKTGKAIFHLDGKGKLADLSLPAVAIRKADEQEKHPPRLLIVQAEVGADGEIIYGVIGRHEIRQISARELTGIKTFAEMDKEEKEAAEKKKGKKE